MNNSPRFALSAPRSTATSDEAETKEVLDGSVRVANWDVELTPTPHRRRHRLASEESLGSDSSKAISLGFSDSGHCSSANASDFRPLTAAHAEPGVQDLLRQKDQALLLALQDVRRLRSELERLSQSERWYKQELRTQKHSRLEALEKLYTNERNYMQENQRLQRECLRLYTKCSEVEHELEEQRGKALVELQRQHERPEPLRRDERQEADCVFEYEQQRALIADQQQLIDVLRKQKRSLLADLKRLSEEKDAKIYELQGTLAQLEQENQKITKKCKTLIGERGAIEAELRDKVIELEGIHVEQQKLEAAAQETRAELEAQQRQLEFKEKEIEDLQRNFKEDLKDEMEADNIHRLSMEYHLQIMQKTPEITTLKTSLFALQQELVELEDVQAQNEQQQREMDRLRSSLVEKDFELTNLRECDAKKSAEIEELKAEIKEYQGISQTMEQSQQQRNNYLGELLISQEALKRAEDELIQVNEKYASMCALCERTRFELDMREIECRKVQFDRREDAEEIQTLRKKLASYLDQTAQLSLRIKELEQHLLAVSKQRVQTENKGQNVRVSNADKSTQWELLFGDKEEPVEGLAETSEERGLRKTALGLESDKDFDSMDAKLLEMNEYMRRLEEEHELLKEYIREKTTGENAEEKRCETNEESGRITQEEHMLDTAAVTESGDDLELKDRFVEMQCFIHQLQLENQQLRQLTEERKNPAQEIHKPSETFATLREETQTLRATLKDLQANEVSNDASKINILANLQKKDAISDNLVREKQELKAKLENMSKLNAQNAKSREEISTELQRAKDAIRILQLQLLTNDGKLYKMEKARDRLVDVMADDRRRVEAEEENKLLRSELATIRLDEALLKQKLQENSERHEETLQENKDLRLRLQELERTVDRLGAQRQLEEPHVEKLGARTVFGRENDDEELLSLREKVVELETKLGEAQTSDDRQREKRIQLITKLLDQQNQKVAQLNASQADWEELLKTLNAAQAQEEATRAELQRKHEQLEELNACFHAQNEELQRLHAVSSMLEARREGEMREMEKTFQEKLDEMKKKVENSESNNEGQAKVIESLRLKNQRLEEDIDEDFARQAAENKKEIRILRNQMEKITGERQEIVERMLDMEQELLELRRSKREAIVAPQIVFPDSDNDSLPVDSSDEGYRGASDDHLRILTKVLENEYKRKMSRYDLHIHSLLINVKSLKRALAAEEQKVSSLQKQHSKTCQELKEYQTTRQQLQETRRRFERSQQTIKHLKREVETTRKQYEATDAGKSTVHEATHEVANLIDDYKKLIQQSVTTTKRPRTSAILDLIQRSNQCVPNLNQLESSVSDLRADLQEYIAGQRGLRNPFLLGPKVPSLLDELRAATELA